MAEHKCRWQDREGEWRDCHLELTGELEQYANFNGEGQCIFHANEKDPGEFRSALAKLIKRWRKNRADHWNFSGFTFVDYAYSERNRHPNLFKFGRFPAKVSFEGAFFKGNPSFQNAEFQGVVSFKSAEFLLWANFAKAEFHGDAYFQGAEFQHGDAYFQGVEFHGDAFFEEAEFQENVYFEEAEFQGWAYFRRARFEKDVYLELVSFALFGDFEDCWIAGKSLWIWPGEGVKLDKESKAEIKRGKLRFYNLSVTDDGELDFRNNVLQKDCELVFEDCDMSRVRLEGTDCTQIKFYANKWAKPHNRVLVGDENLAREERDIGTSKSPVPWNLIQITYQQLAKRFREDFNHQLANDFDRGVFECRREAAKAEGWRGLPALIWITAYKWISDYSGNLWRNFLWWAGLVVVFAMLYSWFTGGYFDWPIDSAALDHMWRMTAYSLKSAIAVVGTDAALFGIEATKEVALLSAIQKLLSGILITLFIFTVRRRFKH